MFKRLVIISFLLLLTGLSACSPEKTSGTKMAEANQLYEAGQFSEAAVMYQALVDAGVEDGALYYNLGNAYFKAGDLGRAILNYRRAQVLEPRNSDVDANLQLARDQTIDELPGESGTLIDSINRFLVERMTLNEAAIFTLVIWLSLCALTVAAILWSRGRRVLRYTIAVIAVLLIAGLISVGILISEERGNDPAVIVAPSVEARSGPGEDYLTEFSLHSGAEVDILEQRDNWARIVLPGNLQGWIPGEAVESL